MGSGTGQGFTPIPNWGVYAILCVWENPKIAEYMIENTPLFKRYRAHSAETTTLFLEAVSSRGAWSGQSPFQAHELRDTGPVAILTRATVRWSKIIKFWRQSPAISEKIGANRDVLFKIGLGEVPLRQQLTFSIWPDIAEMSQFAHHHGPHKQAIQHVRKGKWFKEELYAHFNITAIDGHWSAFDKQTVQEPNYD